MVEARLKAKLWIQAAIRTCVAQGISATVARKGDEDAGAILIKQNLGNGAFRVLSQIRAMDGTPAWLRATGSEPVDERKADAYIARQIDRDWDLWIIEIEDRNGRLPFDAQVVD
jgi:GMP synthase (glutamine-hydrolysing)